jgi:hypothetical protein
VVRGLPQHVVADVRFAADAEHAEEEQGRDNLHAGKATLGFPAHFKYLS